MRLAVPAERVEGERRVSLVPEVTARLVNAGFEVIVEKGAGAAAGFADDAYAAAGATIAATRAEAVGAADIVLRVQPPTSEEIAELRMGAVLAGFLSPLSASAPLPQLAAAGVITADYRKA